MGDVQLQNYRNEKQKIMKEAAAREENRLNNQSMQNSDINEMYKDNNGDALQNLLTEKQVHDKMIQNLNHLQNYVQGWIEEIGRQNCIMDNMSDKEDQQTAHSIEKLLERAQESWRDPR